MKKLLEIAATFQKADPALAVTLKFVLAGMFWVLLSDPILYFLGVESVVLQLPHIQILKGLLFIAVTGGFLFFWSSRYISSLEQRETEVRSLFQSSPIAMGIIDSQTFQFLEVNASLRKLYDISNKDPQDIALADFALEQERFEAVPLLIKTGSLDLGTWKFRKADKIMTVDMKAQSIRRRKAVLVVFTDVTNMVRGERDLISLRSNLEKEFNARLDTLVRMNEELAYRASQTEHVNAELISVNEQLQHVNKKIALRAEDSFWKNDQMNEIMTSMSDVFWSFDLTGRSKSFVSPSARELYDEAEDALLKPWFWLDYIHPEDTTVKEETQQRLMETGQSAATYRIVTPKGNIKLIFSRVKLYHDPKGIPMIMGSATNITDLNSDLSKVRLINPKLSRF